MSKIPDKLPVKEASDVAKLPKFRLPALTRVPEGDPHAPDVSVSFWERSWLVIRQNVTPLIVLVGRVFGLDLSGFFTPQREPVAMNLQKLLTGLAGVALVAIGMYVQEGDPITLAGALEAAGAALVGYLVGKRGQK